MNNHEVVLAALEAARAFVAPMAEPQETYGHFPGGDYDPRTFRPDEESNTPDELAAHKAACEAWERGGERPEIKPSGRTEIVTVPAHVSRKTGESFPEYTGPAHVCGSALGVGTYVYVDEDVAALAAQIDEAIALLRPA